ncbi:MAG TPA: 3-dehydroquinate synthase, partial [Myxococcaceae bacterium]|nr:3-dehydroquinate synthase [Myxococcaceae bacterium]
ASKFGVSHGDAVGLGMRCALDVGRAMGVTPHPVADEVEAALERGATIPGREVMAKALARATVEGVTQVLAADKKAEHVGEVKMVLLTAPGETALATVPANVWKKLLPSWRAGRAA